LGNILECNLEKNGIFGGFEKGKIEYLLKLSLMPAIRSHMKCIIFAFPSILSIKYNQLFLLSKYLLTLKEVGNVRNVEKRA
jgi:hypothetical protein